MGGGSRRETRHTSSGTFLSKSTFTNEIKYRSAEIIISPRRSSQFFSVVLNYKVKQDRLNSKTRPTYDAPRRVFSHAEKMWWWWWCWSGSLGGRHLWPGLFDWEHHFVSGFCLSGKLLQREEALPIQSEAHLNTNVSTALWICHLESRPLVAWQLQQSSFSLHGIRHRFTPSQPPTTDALQPFPHTIGAQMN